MLKSVREPSRGAPPIEWAISSSQTQTALWETATGSSLIMISPGRIAFLSSGLGDGVAAGAGEVVADMALPSAVASPA